MIDTPEYYACSIYTLKETSPERHWTLCMIADAGTIEINVNQ